MTKKFFFISEITETYILHINIVYLLMHNFKAYKLKKPTSILLRLFNSKIYHANFCNIDVKLLK